MFKAVKIAALAGFLISCGDIDFNPQTNCKMPGFRSLEVEGVRDCECLVDNFLQGRKQLENQALIPSGLDFTNLSIKIFEEYENLLEEENLRGRYIPDDVNPEIYLNYWGDSFVHELLHHYEINFLKIDREISAQHKDWGPKGYHAASGLFRTGTMEGGPLGCYN